MYFLPSAKANQAVWFGLVFSLTAKSIFLCVQILARLCDDETDPDERKEKENIFTAIFNWFGVAYEGLVAACK